MGQPNQEPSMEDILASIKRIIAEDGEATQRVMQPPRRKGPVAVPDPDPDGPIADEAISEQAIADEEPADAATIPEAEPEDRVEPADVLELTSPIEEFEDPRMSEQTEPPAAAAILSPAAESASRTAFAALSQLQVRADEGRENTLEGLVADMLRPMLREWLDRELPAMVERLVAAEVSRVSGRG